MTLLSEVCSAKVHTNNISTICKPLQQVLIHQQILILIKRMSKIDLIGFILLESFL
jgi:hypothetical protein